MDGTSDCGYGVLSHVCIFLGRKNKKEYLGTNPGTGDLVRNQVPSVCSVGLVTHQTITHISGKCVTSEC